MWELFECVWPICLWSSTYTYCTLYCMKTTGDSNCATALDIAFLNGFAFHPPGEVVSHRSLVGTTTSLCKGMLLAQLLELSSIPLRPPPDTSSPHPLQNKHVPPSSPTPASQPPSTTPPPPNPPPPTNPPPHPKINNQPLAPLRQPTRISPPSPNLCTCSSSPRPSRKNSNVNPSLCKGASG